MNGSDQLKRRNKFLKYYLAQYNTFRGLRHTVYHSYLRPAFGRPNLKILINSRAHRIRFTNRVATAVAVSEDNFAYPPREIRAQREIILSAGAFHSPQLLKLSGVGPRNELLHHKIPIVRESKNVGENLYDHLNLPLYVTVNTSMSITRSKIVNWKSLADFIIHGSGVYSNFGVVGYLIADNDDYGTGIFGVGTIDERLKKIVNYEKEVQVIVYQEESIKYFFVFFICRRFKGIFRFTKTLSKKGLSCSTRAISQVVEVALNYSQMIFEIHRKSIRIIYNRNTMWNV